MRLTNIQLIHAAHHAARYLPKASAELVRELATRLDVALVAQREAAKQRDALAADNAGLKKYICDECYVESVRTGHYACAGHGMPSTPATDAYLAEVRAQGVEMFGQYHNFSQKLLIQKEAKKFAAQLRQEAAQ